MKRNIKYLHEDFTDYRQLFKNYFELVGKYEEKIEHHDYEIESLQAEIEDLESDKDFCKRNIASSKKKMDITIENLRIFGLLDSVEYIQQHGNSASIYYKNSVEELHRKLSKKFDIDSNGTGYFRVDYLDYTLTFYDEDGKAVGEVFL